MSVGYWRQLGIDPISLEEPNVVSGKSVTKAKWLSQYDMSLGGTYQGINLTLAVFNVFENAMAYDTQNDDYIKGERIVRVNAEYPYKF